METLSIRNVRVKDAPLQHKWPLAPVIGVHLGKDSQIRAIQIKTSTQAPTLYL